jgi:hypothetical protein
MQKVANVELVQAIEDIQAIAAEHESLAGAAFVLGLNPAELNEAATWAVDLHLSHLLPRWGDELAGARSQAERLWAQTYLGAWRLRQQLNYPWPLDELGLAVWIYASAPGIAARHFEFGGEACLLEASSALLPELEAALDEIGDPLWQAIKQLLHNAVACALR